MEHAGRREREALAANIAYLCALFFRVELSAMQKPLRRPGFSKAMIQRIQAPIGPDNPAQSSDHM